MVDAGQVVVCLPDGLHMTATRSSLRSMSSITYLIQVQIHRTSHQQHEPAFSSIGHYVGLEVVLLEEQTEGNCNPHVTHQSH